MKEFKGTPGPWVYRKSQSCVGTVDNSDTQSYGMMLTVANIDKYDHSQYEENAHLIAAAPELLEALQQSTQSMLDSGYSPDSAVIRANQAAIAKALGEDHG